MADRQGHSTSICGPLYWDATEGDKVKPPAVYLEEAAYAAGNFKVPAEISG